MSKTKLEELNEQKQIIKKQILNLEDMEEEINLAIDKEMERLQLT